MYIKEKKIVLKPNQLVVICENESSYRSLMVYC